MSEQKPTSQGQPSGQASPPVTGELNLSIYPMPDDLPEDLRRFVVKRESLSVFQHEFLVDIFPIALPVPIHELLEGRETRALAALDSGDTKSFIFMHQRAFRMDCLRELQSIGHFEDDPASYWQAARSVWMDGEQPESDLRWRWLIEADVPCREQIMTEKERETLAGFDETVTLWRGLQAPSKRHAEQHARQGFSWTLSKAVAEKFSRRLIAKGDRPFLASTMINKSQVIAYLTGRGEEEILVEPAGLEAVTIIAGAAVQEDENDYVSLADFARG